MLYLCKRFQQHKTTNTVDVVQLVRASDCGSECRRFESDQPPCFQKNVPFYHRKERFFISLLPHLALLHQPRKIYNKAVFTFNVSITWVLFVFFVKPNQDKHSAHVRSTEQTNSMAFKQTKNKHTRICKLIKLSTQQPTNL